MTERVDGKSCHITQLQMGEKVISYIRPVFQKIKNKIKEFLKMC